MAVLMERYLRASNRRRKSHQVGALRRPLDIIMLVARQVGFTKVELPFESAPYVILQCSPPIQFVDQPALCRDQRKLDFVVRHSSVLRIRCFLALSLEMREPVRKLGSKPTNNIIRYPPFRSQFVETLSGRFDGASALTHLPFEILARVASAHFRRPPELA